MGKQRRGLEESEVCDVGKNTEEKEGGSAGGGEVCARERLGKATRTLKGGWGARGKGKEKKAGRGQGGGGGGGRGSHWVTWVGGTGNREQMFNGHNVETDEKGKCTQMVPTLRGG